MRRKIVAGNWKSNLLWQDASELIQELNRGVEQRGSLAGWCIIAPPAPFLGLTVAEVDSQIAVAAQNSSATGFGAFTGEQTPEMLKSIGVMYTILGHSERRQYYNETNEVVAQKVRQALKADVTPIVCIGELLEERESGKYLDVVKNQLEIAVLNHVEINEIEAVIIAYEPVWAIGTGRTATAEQAQEMHAAIRSWLRERYSVKADEISILYGGSCKPDNAAELFAGADVDGGLIGGASLKANDFLAIIDAL
ncbi:MAG: triose-phosphate isomerase [Cryomorphaceae bacterium]|nr:triose-phosphate isomerase [Cryomorphaceae bacterium]